MEIRFLGAAGTVSGSRHLVSDEGRHVLVDCGSFQGVKNLRRRNWDPFPIDPREIEAVVLTHAQLDHSGHLPILVRQGFRGPIFATAATRDLTEILLREAGRGFEEDAEGARTRGWSKHADPLPLYTEADVEAVLPLFQCVPFDETVSLAPFSLTLRPAGHLLGASMVALEASGVSVLFSGELGRFRDPVMRPPEFPHAHDVIVMESTYGDRLHPDEDPERIIGDVLTRTAARGGTVIIPAGAVGRAQTILYWIWRARESGRAPDVPVFVDSPLARDFTDLFSEYAHLHRLSPGRCGEVCSVAQPIDTVDGSRALQRRPGPQVIVAPAGMLTGGRVLDHLAHFGRRPENTILLVGFQAEGTRGADLLRGERELKIRGEYVHIRAEVLRTEALSANADKAELLVWLEGAACPPRRVVLVHGEPHSADVLRRTITERLRLETDVAEDGVTFSVPTRPALDLARDAPLR
jgi:metallo-beta-lactamase family protein